jgi:hypothetical protein
MSQTSLRKPNLPDNPISPEELVAELRRLRARIPEYQQLTGREAQGKVRVAYLDPEFIDIGVNAIGAYDGPPSLIGVDAEELRGELSNSDRWTGPQHELKAMLDGVSSANLARRNRIGTTILAAYEIFQRLITLGEHPELIPFVEAMRRAYRTGSGRKKK